MDNSTGTLDPNRKRPGRAARSNQVGRFERQTREFVDDGWEREQDASVQRTNVSLEVPRSVITRNSSPDIPFDRSLNPYRGCEHGCIYCFARPTHAYLGLSPGLDFETELVARPGAADVLRRDLSKRGYEPAVLAMGTNTDPYQPIEARYRIMPQILSVLLDFRHPLGIVTKGSLIERDIGLLSELAAEGLLHVGASVTSLDARLSRLMEPRVPAPARRLKVIERLAAAGIPVRVSVAPVIPSLTDHELEGIVQASADAGAKAANWIMLRLPREVSSLFQEWLSEHFADRAGRVMARVREMHGGQDYQAEWGRRMRGEGHYAQIIGHRFAIAAKRAGLDQDLPSLRTDLFRVPGRAEQLSLF